MKSFFTICLVLFGVMALQAQHLKPFKATTEIMAIRTVKEKLLCSPYMDLQELL